MRTLFAVAVVAAGIAVFTTGTFGAVGEVRSIFREVIPTLSVHILVALLGILVGFLGATLALQGASWLWTWNREKLLGYRIARALNGRTGRIDRFTAFSLLAWGQRFLIFSGKGIARLFRVLSDRYREEYELVRMETEERLERARVEAEKLTRERLELERSRGLDSVPALLQARVLTERLEELPDHRICGGDAENTFFKLYLTLQKRLEKVSKVPLRTREEFADTVFRLNAYEALLLAYDERIRRIKESDLPEDQKAADIAYLERLRENDIAQLEAAA